MVLQHRALTDSSSTLVSPPTNSMKPTVGSPIGVADQSTCGWTATPNSGQTTIVNEWPVDDIADILWRYGEERMARRIARAIVGARPITDTAHLADVVANSVPAAVRRRKHPAKKVFQAIRIAVNDELGSLELGLEAALRWTRPGGRVLVISYHSLEDRIVKRRFAAGTAGCECPPDFPVCTCGRVAELRLPVRKPLRPSRSRDSSQPPCPIRTTARR